MWTQNKNIILSKAWTRSLVWKRWTQGWVARYNARYKDDSRSEENIETSEVVSTNEPVLNIEAGVEVQQEKKRRGHKPKIQTQPIQSTIDKGGRPPLVRNALADDTAVVAPVLRRSNRNKWFFFNWKYSTTLRLNKKIFFIRK
jgi:hypothetical protein